MGALFKMGIPERLETALMTGMALCVLYIGVTGLFEEQANIIIIVSMGLGALLGEFADLDRLVNSLGKKLEKTLGKGETCLAEGFVTATLLFCVGAMTVAVSLLIIALATNMLKLTKIKVMNFIIAIFIPLIICLFI